MKSSIAPESPGLIIPTLVFFLAYPLIIPKWLALVLPVSDSPTYTLPCPQGSSVKQPLPSQHFTIEPYVLLFTRSHSKRYPTKSTTLTFDDLCGSSLWPKYFDINTDLGDDWTLPWGSLWERLNYVASPLAITSLRFALRLSLWLYKGVSLLHIVTMPWRI